MGEKRFRASQRDANGKEADTAPRHHRAGAAWAATRSVTSVRVSRIFFHPDYDRRLWFRTRSADPARAAAKRPSRRERSRARRPKWPTYRRWGISPRPEDALVAGRPAVQSIQQPRSACRDARRRARQPRTAIIGSYAAVRDGSPVRSAATAPFFPLSPPPGQPLRTASAS
jgi:hypothetical protein